MLSFIYVVSHAKTLQYPRRIKWKCTEPIETKIQNTETTSSHLVLPEITWPQLIQSTCTYQDFLNFYPGFEQPSGTRSNQHFCNTQILFLPIGKSLGNHKTKFSDENTMPCSLTEIQTHLPTGFFEKSFWFGEVFAHYLCSALFFLEFEILGVL